MSGVTEQERKRSGMRLYDAATENNLEIVIASLNEGADPNFCNEVRRCVLWPVAKPTPTVLIISILNDALLGLQQLDSTHEGRLKGTWQNSRTAPSCWGDSWEPDACESMCDVRLHKPSLTWHHSNMMNALCRMVKTERMPYYSPPLKQRTREVSSFYTKLVAIRWESMK